MKKTAAAALSLLLFMVLAYGSIGYQLRATVLSREFLLAEIDEADPVRIVKSMLLEQLPAALATEAAPVIDTTLREHKQWLVGQVRTAASAAQDYLLGRSDRIQAAIDMGPLRQTFTENLAAGLKQGVAFNELSPAGQQAFEAGAGRAVHEAIAAIGSYSFDSAAISPDHQVQLHTAREGIRFFQLGWPIVVAAAAVLVIGIVLLGELRLLGLTTLVFGVAFFVPSFFARDVLGLLPFRTRFDLPGVIQAYMPTLYSHLMDPLALVAGISLLVGLVLFGLSFVSMHRRRSSRRRSRSSRSHSPSREREVKYVGRSSTTMVTKNS
jgi:hypothetical protein